MSNTAAGGVRVAVVICDDSYEQQVLMHKWLSDAGITVVGTTDQREEAIAWCADGLVDLLVLDYEMPGDPIGVRGVRERLHPHTRILIWTGYDKTDLPPEDVLAAQGVLTKTIDPAVAVRAVHEALRDSD